MTLFDHRDLLNSEKMFGAVSPTFPTFPDRFVIFLDFFENFEVDHGSSKNRVFGLPSPKKMFKNRFFFNFIIFPKNMILELHFGIFTSGILPTDQK